MDDAKKDKDPYVRPASLVIETACRGVLCSSFGSSGTEGIDPGDSYGDDDFNW